MDIQYDKVEVKKAITDFQNPNTDNTEVKSKQVLTLAIQKSTFLIIIQLVNIKNMPTSFIPVKNQRRPSEPIGSRESKREKPNESKSLPLLYIHFSSYFTSIIDFLNFGRRIHIRTIFSC